MAEDFEVLGMRDEAASYIQQVPEQFEVWPENETIVEAFAALDTQWDLIVGFAGILFKGLDYSRVKDTLEMMGIDRSKWPDTFWGLRIMEAAAKSVLNKKDN